MILGICDTPQSMIVMNIIVKIINILRIVVPIILLFSLVFKFIQASTKGNEDAIASIKKKAVPSIIAAALIFVVPPVINILVSLAFPNNDYSTCLEYISENQIQELYDEKIEKLVLKTEETLDINDYIAAEKYLTHVKDSEKRESFAKRLEEMKGLIDEFRKNDEGSTTGLGMDIVPQEDLIEACKWVLNQEEVKIRLQTCLNEEHRYPNPEVELPGGAVELSAGNAKARETISLFEYQKGVFFGEEKIEVAPESRYAFMIIYKTVILHNTVHYALRALKDPLTGAEITYSAGSCAQNYRSSQRRSKYDSGKYKSEIDDAVDVTKYLVLANEDTGETTDARYHSYTGIEQAIEKAGKEGMDYQTILEDVIKSGNDDSRFYKTARVYDCRNLETGNIGIQNSDVLNPTIYMGDGRTFAYKVLSKKINLNKDKENVIARYKTTHDMYFNDQINKAVDTMSKNEKNTIVLNYGINDINNYSEYCDGYLKLANNMKNDDDIYIVSVNPVDDNKSKNVKNSDILEFNNYMQNTCMNRLQSIRSNIHYCDVYNVLPLERWDKYNYIQEDGIHYTNSGYKYIYNKVKNCILTNK